MLLTSILFIASIAQTSSPAVEVPFRLGEDAIILDASVNNRKVSLMFDTGFGGAVIVDRAVDLGPATGTMGLRDFVGEMEAPTVHIKSLYMGAKKIDSTGMDAVLQSMAGMSFSYGQHCDGIMGFEVIKNNVTEINFQNKKFIFHPKTVDISKRVPDNKTTFLAKLLPIGGNSMEMEVVTPSGKTMTMALDTGNANYATTHRDVLERVGLWDSSKKPKFTGLSGVASGAVESWDFKMPALTIFGIPTQPTIWDIIDLPSSSAEGDGTIGFGFLKNFNIVLDYQRRRVWFEKFTPKHENEPQGELGIRAYYDEHQKKTIIYSVSPESPADKGGVKEKDELLSVGSIDLAANGPRTLRKMMSGAVGSKVKLALSRGGRLIRVELTREPMVNE